MRVNQTGSNPVASSEVAHSGKLDRTSQSKNGKKTEKTSGAENAASISGKAKELAKAKAAAAQAPEVREAKIAELKSRIAAGKYKIDDNAVADRLVNEEISMSGIG